MTESMMVGPRVSSFILDPELQNVLSIDRVIPQVPKTPWIWRFQGLEIFGFAERGPPLGRTYISLTPPVTSPSMDLFLEQRVT